MPKTQHIYGSRRSQAMRLIILVGWPGVGKTTVGQILSILTGYPLLDNHLTYREICRFLKKGSLPAHLLNVKIRHAVIRALINSRVPGVICTLSIRRHPTLAATRNLVQMAEQNSVKVDFVKLMCHWTQHRKRVLSPSRQETTKTNTIAKLKQKMSEPFFESLRSHPPLVIDNTSLTAKQCAQKIITQLHLTS